MYKNSIYYAIYLDSRKNIDSTWAFPVNQVKIFAVKKTFEQMFVIMQCPIYFHAKKVTFFKNELTAEQTLYRGTNMSLQLTWKLSTETYNELFKAGSGDMFDTSETAE